VAGVGLDSSVNLVVAALDLKLVRLLRAAMRGGDCCPGPGCNRLIEPEDRFEPRKRIHPEPLIEPRLHFRPEPFFEPRPVHHPAEVVGVLPGEACPSPELPRADAKLPGSPIQPPWKVLPWQDARGELSRPRTVQKVKVLIGRPDISLKGAVIDIFI
jgi:hypothetical protein